MRTRWLSPIAVVVLAAVIALGAVLDPSGLAAPYTWTGADLLPVAGLWQLAATVVYVPLLLAGVGVLTWAVARGRAPLRTSLLVWGAVVWSAMAAKLVMSLVMAFGDVVYLAWSTGFTGVKATVFGLPVLAVTWLAQLLRRRRASPPSRSTAPPPAQPGAGPAAASKPLLSSASGPGWVAAGVAVALGASVGGVWWGGSPVGYAIGDSPLAPAPEAGPLGCLAAVTLLGVTTWALNRWLSATTSPRALVAGVSALGAAATLGLVQVAIGLPGDLAGGDTFWAPAILLRLAPALSLGALLALATAALVALVPARWTALVPARRTALLPARKGSALPAPMPMAAVVAVVAVAALAVPLLQPGTTTGAPARTKGLTLSADRRIVDADGNEVLLRGVNVNQLEDYFQKFPDRPVTRPLTEADFAGMERMGFNVIRLALSWSALEPRPGHYDPAYLARISWAVRTAAEHGLRTVIDMHQDAWGKGVAAAPGTTCDDGVPMHGWDGAPTWADRFDGAPRCEFTGRDISPAVARAFTNFYQDRDGIQTRLVAAWGMLAERFANEPMVAGYDLLNEPGFGEAPPITSGVLLGRYYDRAIKAIRAGERRGFGFPHLVFFEPSVLWSGLGFEVSVPKDFTDDRLLVFAPHLYNESITIDQGTGLTVTSIERGFDLASRAAAYYGAGLWSGEWGWFGDPASAPIATYTDQEDRHRIGGAFWVWKQSCGDAHAGAGAETGGNLMIEDCATGKDLPPPPEYVAELSRPYPRSAPGRLTRLTSGPASLTAEGEGSGCGLDVWFPGGARPVVRGTGVTGVAARQTAGGWRVTGCTRGAYTLTAHR
ncbi:glycoside hydrolase family 5 protein [Nonomuraea rhodomycinica]|uniref:Cellulase family glycosylhydrolase n=1 Tax=Nonomuraea rhodomycinica TaxID=1712872 RepID=A0A7Y6MGW1_9ACTN|nr:cellulase family glycosylhydrolase [Nonomuraea rhodomycinica]NUW46066.1 cellulase family glycosylhydrolase [Nonomuraea rhodomycinica]